MTNSDSALQSLTAGANDPGRKVLIKGAFVITSEPGVADSYSDILIVGNKIEKIAPDLADQINDASVIVVDATGKIVIPGFVDSHVHAWEGQLRGSDANADIAAYMTFTHGAVAAHMSPEDVALGTKITAAQAINGGVTTIVDNAHNSRSGEHSDAAIAALQQMGIRAVHAVGSPTVGEAGTQLPADLIRLRDQYFSSADQLLTLRSFDIAPSIESWTWANENGFDTVAEFGTLVPDIDKLLASGLAGPGYTFNHASGLTPDQWDRIADAGVAVNVVPRSDSHFGLGAFVPVLDAQRRNIAIGLSCDNEISYGYDIFTEMRVLFTVQRGLANQALWSGDSSAPDAFTVKDVFAAATTGGALNAGLTDVVGSLAPGKAADLVILDLDHVHTKPYGAWLGTVVNFANVSNVDTVFIDGQVRKWGGELVGIDYDALAAEGEDSRTRLWGDLGATLEDIRSGRGPLAASAEDVDERVAEIIATAH